MHGMIQLHHQLSQQENEIPARDCRHQFTSCPPPFQKYNCTPLKGFSLTRSGVGGLGRRSNKRYFELSFAQEKSKPPPRPWEGFNAEAGRRRPRWGSPGAPGEHYNSSPRKNVSASLQPRAVSAGEAAVILRASAHTEVHLRGGGTAERHFSPFPPTPVPSQARSTPREAARPLTSGDGGSDPLQRPSFPPPPRRQSADRKGPRTANQQTAY